LAEKGVKKNRNLIRRRRENKNKALKYTGKYKFINTIHLVCHYARSISKMNRGKLLWILIACSILLFSASVLAADLEGYGGPERDARSNPDLRDDEGPLSSTYVASKILFQPGGSLAGGLAYGDLDNDKADEVVVVGGSGGAGRVTVIEYNSTGNAWNTPTIWEDSQALVDVVVADIDPNEDGEELVVGGYSRNVTVLYWPGGEKQPQIRKIDTLSQQIFGITAGNLNNSHTGMELAVVDGKTENLSIYQSTDQPDVWGKTLLRFNESLRNVEAGEFDPEHDGEELIVLSTNGSVFVVTNSDNKWQIDWIWKDSNNLLDAAIGDADYRYNGNEIVVVGLSNHATMIRKTTAGDWNISELWTAPGGLEGIDIGEFDPSHDNLEIAIGGYSRTVVMLYLDDNTWYAREIYRDQETSQSELNGVVIGEFYSEHAGNELMVVGASGVTTMVNYVHPDFTVSTVSNQKTVEAGKSTVFTIVLDRVSSFEGTVALDVETGLQWNLSSNSVTVPGTSSLTISTGPGTSPGIYIINVSAEFDNTTKILELSLDVQSSDLGDFTLSISPGVLEIERLPDTRVSSDTSATARVITQSINSFSDNVTLEISDLPEYFEAVLSVDKILAGEDSQINVELISNPPKDEDHHTFTVTGTSGNIQHKKVIEIRLFPAPVQNVENSNGDVAGWVPQAQIAMIVIVIALIAIIIILRIYKYRKKENDKNK
jgi:hypothetical protein